MRYRAMECSHYEASSDTCNKFGDFDRYGCSDCVTRFACDYDYINLDAFTDNSKVSSQAEPEADTEASTVAHAYAQSMAGLLHMWALNNADSVHFDEVIAQRDFWLERAADMSGKSTIQELTDVVLMISK